MRILGLLAMAILVPGSGPVTADADGPDFYRVTGVRKGDVLTHLHGG